MGAIRDFSMLLVASLLVHATREVKAQYVPLHRLNPGDTLRVWSPAAGFSKTTLTLLRNEGDTLFLADLPGRKHESNFVARVPFAGLSRVEVRRGNRRSFLHGLFGTISGGAVGLFAGVLIGDEVGAANTERQKTGEQWDVGPAIGAVLGGLLGIPMGAAIGGDIGARERPVWIEVHP